MVEPGRERPASSEGTSLFRGGGLRAQIARGVTGSGGLRIAQAVLGIFVAWLLVRLLGAQGFGYYTFAGTLVSLLAIPAQLGLPRLLARQVAIYSATSEWGLLRGLARWSLKRSVLGTFATAIIAGAILLFSSEKIAALEPGTFALALLLMPILGALGMTQGMLSGFRHVLHALWPSAIVKHLLLAGLLLLFIFTNMDANPVWAMALNIVSFLVALGVSTMLLFRVWPKELQLAELATDQFNWARSLLPFTMLAGVALIVQKTDLLMLGWLSTPENVGVYSIATQGGMLVAFALMTFNAVVAPNIAHLFARQDFSALQRLMTGSTAVITAVSIAAFLILAIFGEWLLTKVFGAEFAVGYLPMVIIGLGQLINACTGSVGVFLTMMGHERDSLAAMSIGAGTNIVLNAILIPQFDMVGAAVATAISTLVWNVILALLVHRRLGLVPGPFPLVRSPLTMRGHTRA